MTSLNEATLRANCWAVINNLYCKGCQLCIDVCRWSLIEVDKEHLTPQGYHPVRVVSGACVGCASCAIICPEGAISVYRSLGHRHEMANAERSI